MNGAVRAAEDLCRKAADAMLRLDFDAALRTVARLRDDFEPDTDPDVAACYLRALWIAAFVHSNLEEDPLDGEFAGVAVAIEALAQRPEPNNLLPPGAQCGAALIGAQKALIDAKYPMALALLRSMLRRDVIRKRMSDFARRPLLPAEKLEAALIVDAYAELARILQRFYLLPFGISHRRAGESQGLLREGLLRSLAENPDVSRWSRRRTTGRVGYEMITLGCLSATSLSEGRAWLDASRSALPADLAQTPLAQLEHRVTEFYYELAKDDAEFDPQRASTILEAAAAHFDQVGLHRRAAELEIEDELLQRRLR